MYTRMITTLFAAALACVAAPVAAQGDFPNRPLRLLVGFPPGGATDLLSRALAQEVRGTLGQEVIVVNRAGATGAIAITEVAAAKPDGHVLGLAPTSAFTLAYHFMDIRPDFIEMTDALMMVARQRVGMVVKGDSPHKTLRDLVEFAKKNPGKVSVGIPGLGTSSEIFTRAIVQHAGIDAIVVPFKGDTEVGTAILGGQIVVGSLSAGGFAQQVRSGTMRLVVSFQNERFQSAPDVPTLEELGYGLTGRNIQMLYGPKKLPPAVAKRLIAAFTEATRSPTYIDIATRNELYDKTVLVGDALTDFLLKDRAANSLLVEKLGLKKQR